MEISFDDLLLPGTESANLAKRSHDQIIESSTSDFDEESDAMDHSTKSDLLSSNSPPKMSTDQERYEQLRRSAFSKNTLKKVINSLTGAGVGPVMLFVIGGFTKVYVGELTEAALQVQSEQGAGGAITPEQLAEGYRRYHKRNFRSSLCNYFPRNSLNARLLCKRL
eukprot:NODE_625_length_5289_cov_0.416956.p4 type:complete len:166 gc:universal NODE_625_length_5289_cov_0.416956:2211-2708(+)